MSESLTIQGVDQQFVAGARARALGNAFTALTGDVNAIFWNPAGLAGLASSAVSAGGVLRQKQWTESQRWNPNRFYGGTSLYFQNPDEYQPAFNPPDWERETRAVRFGYAAASYATSVAGRSLSIGIGVHQFIDLDDYDRNENVLDPHIGNFRPEPVFRPGPGDSVLVEWSEYQRSREGEIYALSPVIAIEPWQNFRVGARVSLLNGSSVDREEHHALGMFVLRSEAHDYDFYPRRGSSQWHGTSSYSGWRATVGAQYEAKYFGLGVVFQSPTSITRTWSREGARTDTMDVRHPIEEEGETNIALPYVLSVGAQLKPQSTITLSFDYRLQNLERMQIEQSLATDALPEWGPVNGLRLGGEWRAFDWLALRIGYREDPQPFYIQGSGILDEMGHGSIYSGGIGINWSLLQFDVAYEYHRLNYFDRWESNVNQAREMQHHILFGATWRL